MSFSSALTGLEGEAVSLVKEVLAAGPPRSKPAQTKMAAALRAVGYPEEKSYWEALYPIPGSLTAPQRALVMLLLESGTPDGMGFSFPNHFELRRQWFEGTGFLEKNTVVLERDGKAVREPLWRAMQVKHLERRGLYLSALDSLPFEATLQALEALFTGGDRTYKLNPTDTFASGELRLVRELREEGRAWALAAAQRFKRVQAPPELVPFIFLALIRAKIPIDEKLEAFFPPPSAVRFRHQKPPPPLYPRFTVEDYFEFVEALPEDRQDAVLSQHIRSMPPERTIALLERFPSPVVARSLLDSCRRDVVEHGSSRTNLDRWISEIRKLAKRHPSLLSAVAASEAGETRALELVVLKREVIRDADHLTPLLTQQLQLAGMLWDGKMLPLKRRIGTKGPKGPPEDDEVSPWWGQVERRQVGDASGKPLYDALLYDIGAGAIFDAGTARQVGFMGDQIGLKLDKPNGPLLLGLRTVLSSKPPSAPSSARKSRTTRNKKGAKRR